MITRADCRALPLADESVHCVITSVPYWSLRDYGLAPSVWPVKASEGVVRCNNGDHVWGSETVERKRGSYGSESTLDGGSQDNGGRVQSISNGSFCSLCGAWRGSLGLEPTLDFYIQHIVECFREVWRVLRDDGVCFLNVGDSYSPTGGNRAGCEGNGPNTCVGPTSDAAMPKFGRVEQRRNNMKMGLKPKDLCLVPFRLAIALQSAGWYVRSVMPWLKGAAKWRDHDQRPKQASVLDSLESPAACLQDGLAACSAPGSNPSSAGFGQDDCGGDGSAGEWVASTNAMPESVTDRPATAVEYVIMLSKSGDYHWDAESVKLLSSENSHSRGTGINPKCEEPGSGNRQNSSFSGAVNKLVPSRNFRNSDLFFKGLLVDPDGDPLAMLVNPNPYSDQLCSACGTVFHSLKRLHARGTCDEDHGGCGRVVEFTGHIKTRKVRGARGWKTPDGWDTSKGDGGHGSFHREGREAGKATLEPDDQGREHTERQCPHCGVWEKWKKIERQCHCGAWGQFESHYASFPVGLVTPLIEAGCPGKVCAECGEPWVRIIEKDSFDRTKDRLYGGTLGHNPSGTVPGSNTRGCPDPKTRTLGWQKQCSCETEATVPGTVCDPFCGTATVGLAAERLGRRWICIDLSEKYCKLARVRTEHAQKPLVMT